MSINSATLWSVISTVFRTGGALLTLPIALQVIPAAEMGLYYTFLSISALGLLLDMGFSQTLIRFTSHAWAGAARFHQQGLPQRPKNKSPNLLLLTRLMTAARFWYTAIGVGIFLVLSIVGGLFVDHKITHEDLTVQLFYCWLAMSVAVGYSFASELWRTLLFGLGHVKESHQVSIVAHMGAIFVTLISLLGGLGLWAFPIAKVVFGTLNFLFAKKIFAKNLSLSFSSWSQGKGLISTMWPTAWRQGIVTIGEFFALRASVIVCASLYGLKATASYGLTLQVLSVIAAICSAPLAVSVPLISEYRIRREKDKLVKLFLSRSYIAIFFILILGAVAVYFGPLLLIMLGSKTVFLETEIFLMLVVIQALNVHQSFWVTLVLTENKNPFVILSILTGLLGVALSWYFGLKHGLRGMILAQAAVSIVFMSWWVVLRGWRGLDISQTNLSEK
jgi:O-antigen/teichoic acid export membrane protein